jgi:hypothetical protein
MSSQHPAHNHVLSVAQGGAVHVRTDTSARRIALGTLATTEVMMTEGEVRGLIQVLADEYTSLTGRRPFAKHGAVTPVSSTDS